MATFATWQQNVTYEARKDRAPISELFGEGVLNLNGGALAVSERSAGANMSVDVAAGRCAVDGDETADQESYLCVFDDSTNLSVASADPDNPRKDRVIVRVEDSAVSGSSDGPVREVLTGTAGSSPSAPAVPDSAISLAIVDVAAGASSITDSDITDDRSEGSAGGAPDPHGHGSHDSSVPRMEVGTYTGNDPDGTVGNRFIDIGWTPTILELVGRDVRLYSRVFKASGDVNRAYRVIFDDTVEEHDEDNDGADDVRSKEGLIVTDGFEVSFPNVSGTWTNFDGHVFTYIAWGAS